jgi:hypothetical protein
MKIENLQNKFIHFVNKFSNLSSAFTDIKDMNDYGIISNQEPGSSVSIVSDYGLDDQGSIPDRGRGFFL